MSIKIKKNTINFINGIKLTSQLQEFLTHGSDSFGFAFVGRSNVGKSTLINALFNNKKTAKTSKTPGRTQQVNVFDFQLSFAREEGEETIPALVFDLPGYGFAKASKTQRHHWKNLMDAFFSSIGHRTAIVCLQDARNPGQEADKILAQYLKQFPLEWFLILNKIDKLKSQKERHAFQKKIPELLSQYKNTKGVFCVSAEKKTGLQELEEAMLVYILERLNDPGLY